MALELNLGQSHLLRELARRVDGQLGSIHNFKI